MRAPLITYGRNRGISRSKEKDTLYANEDTLYATKDKKDKPIIL